MTVSYCCCVLFFHTCWSVKELVKGEYRSELVVIYTPVPRTCCGLFLVQKKSRLFLLCWMNTCSSSTAVATLGQQPTRSPSAADTGRDTDGHSWQGTDINTLAPVKMSGIWIIKLIKWNIYMVYVYLVFVWTLYCFCVIWVFTLAQEFNTPTVSYLNTMISSAESCLLLYCWRQILQ